MKVSDLDEELEREQHLRGARRRDRRDDRRRPRRARRALLPEERRARADAAAAAQAAARLEVGARAGGVRRRAGRPSSRCGRSRCDYQLSGSYAARDDALRDARQRHRHRAVLRRDVDRGRHAQRGARQGAHARRRDDPPRARAGVVRGRPPSRRALERRGRPLRYRRHRHRVRRSLVGRPRGLRGRR